MLEVVAVVDLLQEHQQQVGQVELAAAEVVKEQIELVPNQEQLTLAEEEVEPMLEVQETLEQVVQE